mgnify:FL=1
MTERKDEPVHKHKDCEGYEGLLLAAIVASTMKVKAGLQYAGSGQHQSYPAGIIELGVALDAIDMILSDIVAFVIGNAAQGADDDDQSSHSPL